MTDTAQTAAVAYISTLTDVTDLLGDESGTPWVFQNTFQVQIEGSGKSAICVYLEAAWTTPNIMQTQTFPRLVVDVMSAPSVDALGQIRIRDAEDKNLKIHALLRTHLHHVAGVMPLWGTLRITDSVALSEPVYIPDVDEQQGELKLHRSAYALKVG